MCGSVAAFFQTFKYYAISRKGLNDKRLFSCSKPCLFPKKGHLIFNKSYRYKGINMQMARVEEKTKPSIRLIHIIRSSISYTQAGISSHYVEKSCLFSCLFKYFFVSLPSFHADNASSYVLEGWDDILKKAFAKRFDFDCVELRNL